MPDVDKMPIWVYEFLTTDFYTDSSSGYEGSTIRNWKTKSYKWLKKFLHEKFKEHVEDIEYFSGFCEYWVKCTINGQKWFFTTGDPRFKSCTWMVLNPIKFQNSRGPNINIQYNESFEHNLYYALKLGSGL